jgi:TetR/AcrR family transcriptional regulator
MQNDSFLKLPEARRNELMRIAAEEFIQCGYSGASTNTITRRAGISKGILFHYFGSKKELYLYLLTNMTERLIRHTDMQEKDLSGNSLDDNMAALFAAKAVYFNAYPMEMAFMQQAGQEVSGEVRPEVIRILSGLASVMRNRRAQVAEYTIDRSHLCGGVTREQALECIMLAIEALDARFYAVYRGRGAEVMSKPEPILDLMRLFLGVVCRGLFED